jgi:hypothetical protein
MEIASFLHNAAALITAVLGLMGLLLPGKAAQLTSIRPEGLLGTSEIRATYGGFFLALGVYALYAQADVVFAVAGVAWLGAAGGRLLSVVMDRSVSSKNLAAVVFEAAMGGMLVV